MSQRDQLPRGGLGLSITQAEQATRLLERIVTLLPDEPAIHIEWRRLLVVHQIEGVQVHDARLVAAMKVHGVTHILTQNSKDFARYLEIVAVRPQDI